MLNRITTPVLLFLSLTACGFTSQNDDPQVRLTAKLPVEGLLTVE